MDVLAINGSPHKNGNTAAALEHAAAECSQQGLSCKIVHLADIEIYPCNGCFACRDGDCVHGDDAVALLEEMRCARCILLGSPVYMGMVTGQLKILMDRSVALRIRGYQLSGRIGAGVACGGFRNGGQELTLQNMHTFFLQQDMSAIADGPGFSHSGATIVGDAREDEIGLKTITNMIGKIASILEA